MHYSYSYILKRLTTKPLNARLRMPARLYCGMFEKKNCRITFGASKNDPVREVSLNNKYLFDERNFS